MRALAYLAAFSALFLASCSVNPQTVDARAELAKLKGPETGSIETSLKGQAEQAVQTANYKRAAELYKQLCDKVPANEDYQVALAENLRRSGDNDGSLRVTDALLKKNPQNAAGLEAKGLALMNTGEFAEAADVLGRVMKLDPKRWRTLNGIGVMFAMKGKYDEAIAYFQVALNVSTDNSSVLNNAALTYAIDRKFDRAYESFGRARRHLAEGSAERKHLDLNLALVYAVDGKLDEAEQTAAPHLSKAGLYNNMGFYSYLSKNNELAKSYLNMALTQSPTYYERAWKNLGAMTGEMASGGPDVQGTSTHSQYASPAPAAGISLDEIPEAKPQQQSSDIADSATEMNNVKSKGKGKKTKAAPAAEPQAAAPAPQAQVPLVEMPAANPDIVLKTPGALNDPTPGGGNAPSISDRQTMGSGPDIKNKQTMGSTSGGTQ